ncbi:hypothetical protein AB0J38_27800 [Streptomyces sp. NPDC050095]|uniref:hypothetical protein n=1 Tax=unclassified Streptomyces TaxID=2593676 RepID=UPI0034129D72
MSVVYDGDRATMTCDRTGCSAVLVDEEAVTASHVYQRSRAAGWKFCRPSPYEQTDICPDCPPDEHY